MKGAPELPLHKPDGGGAPLADTKSLADVTKNSIGCVAAPAENPDWKWWDDEENRDAIVRLTQLALAAFENVHREIVIRQFDPMLDEDKCIYVLREHVPALILRLQELIGQ